jgi:hypothetical protein
MLNAIRTRANISTLELGIIIILVSLITGSSLDELLPALSKVLRVLAYSSVVLFSIWHALPILNNPVRHLTSFYRRYRSYLFAVGLYFLGLIIGGLRGPEPLYSLWQTLSDAIVFIYAFVVFGIVEQDHSQIVKRIFTVTAIWTGLLLLGSLVIYVGNLADWWLINPYYHPDAGRTAMLMNGPFRQANHLAYILMIGAFASGYLAFLSKDSIDWKHLLLSAFLCGGVALTFGRGAMLGTATGLLIMIIVRDRRIGLLAALGAVVLIAYLVAGALSLISVPSFLPKISFAGRAELWDAAIGNLQLYGPLGVGSGQSESLVGMSIHNFFLEQYGEGGIITLVGVLMWLVIPIITIRKSGLDRNIKVAILAVMVGIMVHGLFWSQFLNGLRILSLVGVMLWTALATVRVTDHEQMSVQQDRTST